MSVGYPAESRILPYMHGPFDANLDDTISNQKRQTSSNQPASIELENKTFVWGLGTLSPVCSRTFGANRRYPMWSSKAYIQKPLRQTTRHIVAAELSPSKRSFNCGAQSWKPTSLSRLSIMERVELLESSLCKPNGWLPEVELHTLLDRCAPLLRQEENIVPINFGAYECAKGKSKDSISRITVVGDTHGQFFDFRRIFHLNGYPSASHCYVFNGMWF